MDSLKPDAEDVDHFKERANSVKNKKIAQKPSKNTSKSSSGGVEKLSKTNGSGFSMYSWMLFAILLLTLGFAGYTYYQQTARILVLESDLKNDRNFIRQSKLLMARLEGRLTETGSEIQQSGSELQKKLKFLDSELAFLGSEVRKLWGVSWDRNKKAIAANKSSFAKISKALVNTQKKVVVQSQLISGLDTQHKAVEESDNRRFELMASNIKALNAKWVETNSGMMLSNSKLASLENDFKRTISDVAKLEKMLAPLVVAVGKGNNLQQTVVSNAETIKSINASRIQLNARLVSLSAQLNSLEKKVSIKEARGVKKNVPKAVNKNAQVSGRSESQVRRVKVP